jgi:phage terminase small subunit
MAESKQKLTHKQVAFINEYLVCWNAAEAARRAGYSEKTARVTGPENLTKPAIAEAIQERARQMTMTADEALYRLTQMARGSMTDFIDPETLTIDLQRAKEAGALGLVKRITHTQTEGRESVTIELYDAQAALEKVITLKRLTSGDPTSRVEVNVRNLPDLPPDTLDAIPA